MSRSNYRLENALFDNLRWLVQYGLPYRLGGDSTVQGLDCSGFIWLLFNMSGIIFPRVTAADLFSDYTQEHPDSSWGHLAELLKLDITLGSESTQFFDHVSWVIGNDMHAEASTSVHISGVSAPMHELAAYWSSVKLANTANEYGRFREYVGSIFNIGAFTPENHWLDDAPQYDAEWYYSNREVAGILEWAKVNLAWYRNPIEGVVKYSSGGAVSAKPGLPYYWMNKDYFDDDNSEGLDYGSKAIVYSILNSIAIQFLLSVVGYVGQILENLETSVTNWEKFKTFMEEFTARILHTAFRFIPFQPVVPVLIFTIIDAIIAEFTEDDPSPISVVGFRTHVANEMALYLKSGVVINNRSTLNPRYLKRSAVKVAPWLSGQAVRSM